MAEQSAEEIIRLLADIESRSQQFSPGLPKEEVALLWEGVLFTVVGLKMIAPLDEVKEILNYPSAVTPVPGSAEWMLGVANSRGNLLPIIDLQVYLGGKPISIGRRTRVLIINHEGLYAGLLVADVQGMRHFSDEQLTSGDVPVKEVLPFVTKAYEYEGTIRPVFSMNRLAIESEFRVAAV